MSVGLLDVNMLIALAWPSHVHHGIAHHWFAENQTSGWATCPLTQCAFVRISSNPRFISSAVDPIEAYSLLRRIATVGGHEFWPDDVSLAGETHIHPEHVVGHQQVTDAYLLELAIRNQGKLVTLDRGLGALLPPGGIYAESLEIIALEETRP